jgi:signal transduction histidine kinase
MLDYSYFYICFQGILLFQVVFITAQTFIIKRIEYSYYLIYLVLLILYNHSMLEPGTSALQDFMFPAGVRSFFDKPVIVLSFYMYYHFARHFLQIPEKFPAFNKKIKRIEWILLIYVFVQITLLLTIGEGIIDTWAFHIMSAFNLIASTWSVISFMRKQKTPLNYFILIGALIITTGAVISMVFIILNVQLVFPHLVVFQFFIILEIMVFTSGLAYKSRLIETQKLESEQKLVNELIEKEYLQKSMQELRNKIAGDLHDDLGSTLGSIGIYAEAAKKDLDPASDEKVSEILKRISALAVDSLKNLREMVWIISPGNEKWKDLHSRMENYGKNVLNTQNISFKIDSTIHGEVSLSMIQRRNLYLIFKECIHNILKHSNAKNVILKTTCNSAGDFIFSMGDDGTGQKDTISSNGYGLKSLFARSSELNGSFRLENNTTQGIVVIIEFPLYQKPTPT